jgi:protease I
MKMSFLTKILIAVMTIGLNHSFAAQSKKILMIINEGFQVDEYFTPKKIFEKAGFKVKTASRYGGKVQPTRKYIKQYGQVPTDMSFEEVKVSDYDAITFTGGSGAWTDYFPNKTLHDILIQSVNRKEMIVGLICAGTGLLATAHNLDGSTPQFKGRHVTGYGEVSGLLKTLGQVQYDSGDLTKPYVVEDGNLITGRDPMSAEAFGQAVTNKLNTL